MRNWKTTGGLDLVREDVRLIHGRIGASFRQRGERVPRMLGAATCETDADVYVYQIHFELAPGVVLRTFHGFTEDIEEEGFPFWMAPLAADEAAASIISYLNLGSENLSDTLHDLRLRARRILSRRADDGNSGRLIDIQLTAERRTKVSEPSVRVRLEGLDTQLRGKIDDIPVDDLDTFDDRVGRWSEDMAPRYAARRAFDVAGASGSIDMLTLAAVSTFADPQAWLRSLAGSGWPKHPLNVTVFAHDGAFRSHGHDPASDLSWNRDTVRVCVTLPAATLATCKGRPITDLIEHPMLSSEMTIIDVTNDVFMTESATSIRISQPRLLFCTGSGRTWPCGP
ncbi:hypothetical protein [uncultured Sphingomonas sp.]|uniref:hypothetical protein n=1 Tax=uncultured Sphingomonas sp. TaxID=158754 RepID=UPI0025D26EAC|nr:hypothetical protein [uncultured Sphingomonas sp.]